MATEITQEFVKSALDYNSETGIFTWKTDRPLDHFKTVGAQKTYLGRFAGKVAGYKIKMSPDNDLTYVQIRLCGQLFLAHRLACLYQYGFLPEGLVDHLDGDGLNNRLDNLRIVDAATNARNGKLSKNNTSGVNGVYWNKANSNWVAEGHYTEFGVNKKKSLGSYTNLEDAKNARKAWEISQGNFTERHGKYGG